MFKTYITLGFSHIHTIAGQTFDHNCVMVINHTHKELGRDIAFALLGDKFCFEYPEQYWDDDKMNNYFKDGYKEVDQKVVDEIEANFALHM